jgi:hypothetical protein
VNAIRNTRQSWPRSQSPVGSVLVEPRSFDEQKALHKYAQAIDQFLGKDFGLILDPAQ